MNRRIRILLCDDYAPARKYAREILEVVEDFEVAGEAGDGSSAVELARQLKPQFVLMDIALPDLPGSVATRQILADNPEMKVLAFSSETQWPAVEDMMAAGAAGYVLKNGNASQLLLAIITVLAGGYFISPDIRRPDQVAPE